MKPIWESIFDTSGTSEGYNKQFDEPNSRESKIQKQPVAAISMLSLQLQHIILKTELEKSLYQLEIIDGKKQLYEPKSRESEIQKQPEEVISMLDPAPAYNNQN